MTTYLLITSDKPTELTAFVGPKEPEIPRSNSYASRIEWGQYDEEIETAKASRLPVVNPVNVKDAIGFWFPEKRYLENVGTLQLDTPVEIEGWEPEIVYQEAYLSGEGEIWKKCSIDRFNNIRHLDCKRQAYRLKRSEPVKECKHQYPRSIERSNRVCGLCGHAEETSEIESPIEAKTQDVIDFSSLREVLNQLQSIIDQDWDNRLRDCWNAISDHITKYENPESHKTQESQKEELDGWHEVNIGGMVFKCKSGDDADYLLKAYIHYNEKRYIPSVNEDNWKMLHDAVAKENASKGLIIVQLRKDLEDVRKVCFDLGRVIEWSKNTPPFYSIDDKKDSF